MIKFDKFIHTVRVHDIFRYAQGNLKHITSLG